MNDSFSILLASAIESLPDVRYTQKSALDTQIHNMGLTDPKNAVEASTEGLDHVGKIYDKFMDGQTPFADSTHTAMFTRLADSFVDAFKTARAEVRDTAKVVDLMTNEVARRVQNLMSEDPRTVHLIKNPKGETKLNTVRWDRLNDIDERKLVNVLHQDHGLPTDRIDRSSMVLVLNHLPFANAAMERPVSRIDIPEERADAILARLKKALKGVVSERSIRTVVAGVFNMTENSCYRIMNNLRRYAEDPYSVNINDLLDNVYVYQKVLPLMTEDLLDLAPSTYDVVRDHIQILADYVHGAAYICSYYRNDVWKDAIEVPGRLINTDLWNSYKEKGGTVLHLVQYNNRYFEEDEKLPPAGVSLNHAVETIGEVERSAEKAAGVTLDELNSIRRKMVRDSFLAVAVEALRSFEKSKKLSPSFSNRDFLSFAQSCYDNTDHAPLENACYQVIIKSRYLGTATEQLYNNYSAEITNMASKARNLSKTDCELLEAKVMTDMMVNFMLDHDILTVD